MHCKYGIVKFRKLFIRKNRSIRIELYDKLAARIVRKTSGKNKRLVTINNIFFSERRIYEKVYSDFEVGMSIYAVVNY